MGIKIVEKKIYCVGGKSFPSEKEAEDFMKLAKDVISTHDFFLVRTKPDLIEGRGYFNKFILATPKITGINSAFIYLINEYGSPVSFIQGVEPMNTYIVIETKFTLEELIDNEVTFVDNSGSLNTKYNSIFDNY